METRGWAVGTKSQIAVAVILAALGCGSDGHPDTGAGAGQTPPATENCVDLCQRIADCFVILCNEDTQSTRYEAVRTIAATECQTTCTDEAVMSRFSPAAWQCTFLSSCRQVLEDAACIRPSTYSCT